MDKRTAKSRAYGHVANVIGQALADGWETLDMYGADRGVVEAAIEEVSAEMERRACGGPRSVKESRDSA